MALGVVSGLVPQLPVNAAAPPAQLVGGLLLLALLASLVLAAWQEQAATLFARLPGG